MPSDDKGWGWFNNQAGKQDSEALPQDLATAIAFAKCFRGKDGEQALLHLRSLTIERALGPAASDALLRHVEGQRQLVFYILSLIERGRGGHQTDF